MATAQVNPMLHPLDDFYSQASRPLPDVKLLSESGVPQPYRALLVHERDMTPTLEEHYQSQVRLKVLSRQKRGGFYYREVLLFSSANPNEAQPIEFGAIKINLNSLPLPAQKEVVSELMPFGNVLAKYKVIHSSKPKGYFSVRADEFISALLGCPIAAELYGRRNTLFSEEMRPIAEIVEILPPAL
ncbi:MAG: hypothetical protein SFY81_04130 [Verrucomicrobiota bacterium]|nr:hypothetical protein [Verrucomicrobiota bacterium]